MTIKKLMVIFSDLDNTSGVIETDFGGGAVRDNKDLNDMISSLTAFGRVGLPMTSVVWLRFFVRTMPNGSMVSSLKFRAA